MRVLIDTNIFISHLLGPHRAGSIGEIFTALEEERFTLLLPERLLDELLSTVRRKPRLAGRLPPSYLEEYLRLLRTLGEIIPRITTPIPAVTRDPKDDYLLAYALIGGADFLVTGDQDLLVMNEHVDELRIVTARQFVEDALGRT